MWCYTVKKDRDVKVMAVCVRREYVPRTNAANLVDLIVQQQQQCLSRRGRGGVKCAFFPPKSYYGTNDPKSK